MSCEDCAYKREAKEEKLVPYSAVELVNEAHSIDKKRAWLLALLLALLLFLSNGIWLYAWMQYDYAGVTDIDDYTQDGRGINIIGNDNEAGQYEPALHQGSSDENP